MNKVSLNIEEALKDVNDWGALQVTDKGDYAGWANPESGLDIGNIGGSMACCSKRLRPV